MVPSLFPLHENEFLKLAPAILVLSGGPPFMYSTAFVSVVAGVVLFLVMLMAGLAVIGWMT
jgi:hypothetical protein